MFKKSPEKLLLEAKRLEEEGDGHLAGARGDGSGGDRRRHLLPALKAYGECYRVINKADASAETGTEWRDLIARLDVKTTELQQIKADLET